MILTDCHVHSDFSSDSFVKAEQMTEAALSAGLREICFTEHMDYDYVRQPSDSENLFQLDTPAYLRSCRLLQEKYDGKLRVGFGVELGLQPHLKEYCSSYVSRYPFDFVIGSSHLCAREDPYLPSFFERRSEEEGYRLYFESVLENVRLFEDYDVYGHIDYVVRYGPERERRYSYGKYADLLDEILRELIERGKGIELNTSGWKYGLSQAHPSREMLQKYRSLGGEILTIGSDAHKPEHLCYDFDRALHLLRECGYTYYTVFHERKAEFIRL